jgi:hypothetical protein
MIKMLKRDNHLGLKSIESIGEKIGRTRQTIDREKKENKEGSEVEMRLREHFPVQAQKVDQLLQQRYKENEVPIYSADDGVIPVYENKNNEKPDQNNNTLQATVAEILSRVINIEATLTSLLAARNGIASNDKKEE